MSNENQQAMKNYYIVKLDISSKQKYIYSSNRLQEIIGASKIIEFITEMLGRDVLLKMNRDSFNKDYVCLKDLEVKDMKDINKKAFEEVSKFYTEKRKDKIDEIIRKPKYENLEIIKDQKYYFEKYEEGYKEENKEYTYNPYSNVLFEAGGNAMYIFNTEKQAREFNRRVSRFVLKYFKGIELVSVIQRYNEEAHFIIDIFDEIEKKITAKKNKRNNYINTLSFGFNELCPNTRNPAGYEVVYPSDYENEAFRSSILSKEAFDKKLFYNLLINLIRMINDEEKEKNKKDKENNKEKLNIKERLSNKISTKRSGIYAEANLHFNNDISFDYDLEATTLQELFDRFYEFKNVNRLGKLDKLSSKDKKEITVELDKLSGKKTEGSYIGITCLDGNSMGVKVFEFKEKYKDEFKNQNEKNSAEKFKKIQIAREFANLDAEDIFKDDKDVVKNADEIKNKEECKEIYNDFDCYDLVFEVSNGITSMVVKDKENVASDKQDDGLKYGAKTIIEELLEKYQDRKNITDKVKLANQNYLTDYIIFTTSIKNAYTQAFEDLKREIYEYKYEHESNKNNEEDGSVLPIVPVILAGDDISFLSFGKYSIEITRKYINHLCKQRFIEHQGIDKIMGKLYVCSGTAIIPRNYPFAQGVKIASALESSTKKRLTAMKKKKLEPVEFKDRNDTYLESAVFKAFKDKFENESAWYHNLAIRKKCEENSSNKNNEQNEEDNNKNNKQKKNDNNTKLVIIKPNTKDNTISKYDASLMDWQIVRGDANADIDSFRNSNLTNRPYLIYDEYDARNEGDNKSKENINKDDDINFKASDCYDFSFLEQLEKEENSTSDTTELKILFDISLLKYIQSKVQDEDRNSIYSKLMRSFKDSQESALLVELKHNLSHDKNENKINLGMTNFRKIIHDAIEVKGFFDELELDPEIKNDKN